VGECIPELNVRVLLNHPHPSPPPQAGEGEEVVARMKRSEIRGTADATAPDCVALHPGYGITLIPFAWH
jgi:hypothetical protein